MWMMMMMIMKSKKVQSTSSLEWPRLTAQPCRRRNITNKAKTEAAKKMEVNGDLNEFKSVKVTKQRKEKVKKKEE